MTDERPWALQQTEPCAECGFVPLAVPEAGLADAMRAEGAAWQAWLLEHADDPALERRQGSDTWCAIVYGCHVRDVIAEFTGRTARVLTEDEPTFSWWDHEAVDHYAGTNPTDLAAALAANADRYAALLGTVTADGWQRIGLRRDAEVFTVAGLARFVLHESVHHRQDATRSL